ncbi:MAG: PilN domain-containing protein [Patulibacter sp.]
MRAVNLVPADQRSSIGFNPGQSGGLAYVVVGALGAALLCTYAYANADKQLSQAKRDTQTITATANSHATAAAGYGSYQTALTSVQQRVSAIESLASARFDWAGTMRELARVTPRDVQLSTLSLDVGGGNGAGGAPTVKINGCAADTETVADFISRLEAMRRVTSVALSNTTAGGTAAGDAAGSGACTVAESYRTFAIDVQYQAGTARPAADATTTTAATTTTTATTPDAAATTPTTATQPNAAVATPAATTPAAGATAGAGSTDGASATLTTTPDATGGTTP